MRALRATLVVIAAFQAVLGLALIVAPDASARLLGLEPPAPAWATWLLAMLGARALGYAYGMLLAARDPDRHVAWIDSMIGVQVIDWLATVVVLASGELTLAQVSTAAFLPVVFVAVLGWWRWHRRGPARSGPEVGTARTYQ